MNLTKEKNWIKKQIDQASDEDLLLAVRKLLEYSTKVSAMPKLSVSEVKKSLKRAEKDIEEGRLYLQEDVVKYVKRKRK